jgi:hypothetical protein
VRPKFKENRLWCLLQDKEPAHFLGVIGEFLVK